MRMFQANIVCLWKKSFGRTTEEHSSYNIENDLYTISRTLKGLRSRWTFMGLGGAGAPPRCYYGIERTICSTLCYFRSLIYENCVSVQSVQPQPRRAASESIFNNFLMKKQISPKADFFPITEKFNLSSAEKSIFPHMLGGKMDFSTYFGRKNQIFQKLIFSQKRKFFSTYRVRKNVKVAPALRRNDTSVLSLRRY